MAPMSAAVSARSNRSGLSTWVRALVWPGDARMAVIAESTPAMVHATVEVRRTQTPDSRADSVFSAMARMASPHGENRMNAARARVTIGATMRVSTSARLEQVRPDVQRHVDRQREGAEQFLRAHERQHGDEVQHLRQADRRHHHHDAGSVEQPAQHQLGQRPGTGGDAQHHDRARTSN